MLTLPEPLAPLAAWPQFVCWIAVPHQTIAGKFTKLPVRWDNGVVCDSQDPANWTNADNALAMCRRWDKGHGCGAGFIFTDHDPFYFLDIDGALMPDGQWSALALDLCTRLAGAAVEVSHSGRGLHIIGMTVPISHRTRDTSNGLELYSTKRFVALTGTGAMGTAAYDSSAALAPIVAQFFPPDVLTLNPQDWTDAPVDEWSGPAEDAELIRRALAAGAKNPQAAFGGKETFRDLWEGKIDANRRSESDQSLANHLAFWTGKDCARIERLMRSSGLARDKWDSPAHVHYLRTTILKACAVVAKVAQEKAPPPVLTPLGPGVAPMRGANQYLMGGDQPAYFAGCYYVTARHQIFCLHRNQVLNKSSFDVLFGGYRFALDPAGEKLTDSAFDAFTMSRVNVPPIVDDLCFRPEIPSGQVINEGLRHYVNSYVPHECESIPGDPSPFLNLLAKMLPDDRDRDILIHYLAFLAQHPGYKAQWWPVIQGVAGNGKTLLIRLATYMSGEHYSHLPNTSAMAKEGIKFNGWIDRKLFVGLEEIYLGKKRDFLEELKPMVTNDRLPMERKGVDANNTDNRVNGLMLTNWRDGVPVTPDERRYAIFYCAQQAHGDLARDGMDGDYFPDLYDWFNGRNRYQGVTPGKAVISHYLRSFPMRAEFDPTRDAHRAPRTSSFMDALVESYGRVEQEICEAIEEGRPGFAGGWVSSLALNNLLDHIRAYVAPRKRRALMQSLGYDVHPALADGRVDNPVMPDNGKPRLYLTAGHAALSLVDRKAVAEAYSRAQEPNAQEAQRAAVLAFEPRRPAA